MSSGIMHLHRHRSFLQKRFPRRTCLEIDVSLMLQVDSRVFRRISPLTLTPSTIQACLRCSCSSSTMRYQFIIWLLPLPLQVERFNESCPILYTSPLTVTTLSFAFSLSDIIPVLFPLISLSIYTVERPSWDRDKVCRPAST